MKISRTALALGLILVAILALAAGSAMAADANTRTMTLSGTGTVTAKPDQAVITLGVESDAKTAGEALARNNAAMQAVMKVLSDQGLASKDIQTSTFSVAPQIVYPKNSRNEAPRITGYKVTNQVTATIRDLDKIGILLDKAVSAGANSVNNISFAVSEPQPLLDEARRLAVRDATRKAELYATAAGVKLGVITSLTEAGSGNVPRYQRTNIAAAESAVPIAAGQQTLQMQVTITWALAD